MRKSLFALGLCSISIMQVAHAQSRLQSILDNGVLRVGTTWRLEPNVGERSHDKSL